MFIIASVTLNCRLWSWHTHCMIWSNDLWSMLIENTREMKYSYKACLYTTIFNKIWNCNEEFQIIWTASVVIMVSVLASIAVDHRFEPQSGQTKDYKIGICCFSAKHAALRRKSKDWLARNQDNVFEWGVMSISGLLFQWASTIKIQLSVLV